MAHDHDYELRVSGLVPIGLDGRGNIDVAAQELTTVLSGISRTRPASTRVCIHSVPWISRWLRCDRCWSRQSRAHPATIRSDDPEGGGRSQPGRMLGPEE
jgi:hypothetical protein